MSVMCGHSLVSCHGRDGVDDLVNFNFKFSSLLTNSGGEDEIMLVKEHSGRR